MGSSGHGVSGRNESFDIQPGLLGPSRPSLHRRLSERKQRPRLIYERPFTRDVVGASFIITRSQLRSLATFLEGVTRRRRIRSSGVGKEERSRIAATHVHGMLMADVPLEWFLENARRRDEVENVLLEAVPSTRRWSSVARMESDLPPSP